MKDLYEKMQDVYISLHGCTTNDFQYCSLKCPYRQYKNKCYIMLMEDAARVLKTHKETLIDDRK